MMTDSKQAAKFREIAERHGFGVKVKYHRVDDIYEEFIPDEKILLVLQDTWREACEWQREQDIWAVGALRRKAPRSNDGASWWDEPLYEAAEAIRRGGQNKPHPFACKCETCLPGVAPINSSESDYLG